MRCSSKDGLFQGKLNLPGNRCMVENMYPCLKKIPRCLITRFFQSNTMICSYLLVKLFYSFCLWKAGEWVCCTQAIQPTECILRSKVTGKSRWTHKKSLKSTPERASCMLCNMVLQIYCLCRQFDLNHTLKKVSEIVGLFRLVCLTLLPTWLAVTKENCPQTRETWESKVQTTQIARWGVGFRLFWRAQRDIRANLPRENIFDWLCLLRATDPSFNEAICSYFPLLGPKMALV